jgi:hypothetical protein
MALAVPFLQLAGMRLYLTFDLNDFEPVSNVNKITQYSKDLMLFELPSFLYGVQYNAKVLRVGHGLSLLFLRGQHYI